MSAIAFSHAKDADLAWVEGQIHFVNPSTTPNVNPSTAGNAASQNANGEKNENKELNLVPTLDTVPSAEVRRGNIHGDSVI